jgi:WhiB family redox-sensing transcriptional regulator
LLFYRQELLNFDNNRLFRKAFSLSTDPKTPKQKLPNKSTEPLDLSDIPGKTWFDYASCKGKTELMFPKQHKDITYIAQARAICKSCPVRAECLEYALEFPAADMHGVWAGLTSRQLAAEQRRRKIKPIRPTLAQMWGD